jgi:hypothetical protein
MFSTAAQEVLRIFIRASNARLRQAIVTGKHEVVRAEMEHLKNLSKRMRKVSEGTYD